MCRMGVRRPSAWMLFAGITASFTLVASAQNNLVDVLKKKYTITQTTLTRSQITQPGVVMAIQANGINAEPWDTIVTFDNQIVDGAVKQRSKMFDVIKSKNLKILQPGDKVYITKIEGKPDSKGDQLKFSIISCDALDVDGGASQKRFTATVSFRLQKDGLLQTPPDEAQHMIEAVMAPDSGDGGKAEQGPAPSAPAAPQARASAVPLPPAPPPPSAPVQTQSISIGQTPEQVIASMGQPQQIVDLGAKKTYKYKDLKVIFVNGRVSDVQ